MQLCGTTHKHKPGQRALQDPGAWHLPAERDAVSVGGAVEACERHFCGHLCVVLPTPVDVHDVEDQVVRMVRHRAQVAAVGKRCGTSRLKPLCAAVVAVLHDLLRHAKSYTIVL